MQCERSGECVIFVWIRDLCIESHISDPLQKCFEPSARIKVQTLCQRSARLSERSILMLTPWVTLEGGLNLTVIACAPNVCQDSETQALRAALFLSSQRLSAKWWWMWCTLICDRQVGARTQMTSRIWDDAFLSHCRSIWPQHSKLQNVVLFLLWLNDIKCLTAHAVHYVFRT